MMCKAAINEFTEQRLVRAYACLFLIPSGKDGTRSVSLARFGNYEVRIIELDDDPHPPPIWIELYAHDMARALDSCAFDDLEQATAAVERLILQARQLDEECGRAARGSRH